LLLLARIENHQFPDEREVSFAAIATEVLAEFADLAEHREVALQFTTTGDLRASMDPALARTLVTNLLKNAMLHNRPGGSVSVQVDEGCFTVRNPGVTPLDAGRIFTRFHKETTADGGTFELVAPEPAAYLITVDLGPGYESADGQARATVDVNLADGSLDGIEVRMVRV